MAAAQSGTARERPADLWPQLVVAPWGEVLADGGTEPGVMVADIDLARGRAKARRRIPALNHDRDFKLFRSR